MISINDAVNVNELAESIELLSGTIGKMRSAGPLSFQDVQKAASSLTRAQLVLNELERIEIRERGVSLDMAERFAELDSRIRAIRNDLYRGLTSRRPEGAGGEPTTGKGEDGGNGNDLAR